MQITITGHRGEGCSTVAALIFKVLKRFKFDVKVVARSALTHKAIKIESSLSDEAFEMKLDRVVKVVIVDGLDQGKAGY